MKKVFLILLLIPLLIDAQLQVVSNMRGGKGTTIVTNSIRGHVELVGGMKWKGMVQLKNLDEDTVYGLNLMGKDKEEIP